MYTHMYDIRGTTSAKSAHGLATTLQRERESVCERERERGREIERERGGERESMCVCEEGGSPPPCRETLPGF